MHCKKAFTFQIKFSCVKSKITYLTIQNKGYLLIHALINNSEICRQNATLQSALLDMMLTNLYSSEEANWFTQIWNVFTYIDIPQWLDHSAWHAQRGVSYLSRTNCTDAVFIPVDNVDVKRRSQTYISTKCSHKVKIIMPHHAFNAKVINSKSFSFFVRWF